MCTILGCEVSRHLEIDHNIPVAEGGRTELANLGRPCHHHHHDQNTRGNLRRHGPPRQQRLVTKTEYARLIAEERAPPTQQAA